MSTSEAEAVYTRGIQLTSFLELQFKVLPRLFGSPEKSRNYRRVRLDLVLFAPVSASVTLTIGRIAVPSGTRTVLIANQQYNLTSGLLQPVRFELESTRSGFQKYYILVNSVSGSVYLVGAWLCIDEYYDYGSDNLLN